MDPRPVVSLDLPESKVKVNLYGYLNTAGSRQVKIKLFSGVKIDASPDAEKSQKEQIDDAMRNLPLSIGLEAQNEALKYLIKSVELPDGTSLIGESAIQYLNNLTEADGDVLFEKVDEISNKSRLSESQKKELPPQPST